MAKPSIYLSDKFYVPVTAIRKSEVIERYTHYFYEEQACRRCDNLPDRHNDVCDACPSFKDKVRLFTKVEMEDGELYYGLPLGDRSFIKREWGFNSKNYRIVDNRTGEPFDYKIKFLLDLRDYQEPFVDDLVASTYGVGKSGPRTGKTAMSMCAAIELGEKTLFIAAQTDWLQQFIYHVEGNEANDIPKCTNLPELEKKHGKKLYGFPKTKQDLRDFQFFFVTYQSLLSEKGQDLMEELMKICGTVVCDEVHKAGANELARILNSLSCANRLGVTGTYDRKDGRIILVKQIVGPIVAQTTVEMMKPTVHIHATGFTGKVSNNWTYAMKKLASSKKRNKFIASKIVEDIKAGRSCVVPVYFKNHAIEIARLVNEEMGKIVCALFFGGGSEKNKREREHILHQASTRKIMCVVGIRSLLQLGLNVPPWEVIHVCMPISNEPNLEQETKRVCTPLEGKKPIVRLYFDEEVGVSVGCAKNSLKSMLSVFKYNLAKTSESQSHASYLLSKGRKDVYGDEEYTPRRLVESNKKPSLKELWK